MPPPLTSAGGELTEEERAAAAARLAASSSQRGLHGPSPLVGSQNTSGQQDTASSARRSLDAAALEAFESAPPAPDSTSTLTESPGAKTDKPQMQDDKPAPAQVAPAPAQPASTAAVLARSTQSRSKASEASTASEADTPWTNFFKHRPRTAVGGGVGMTLGAASAIAGMVLLTTTGWTGIGLLFAGLLMFVAAIAIFSSAYRDVNNRDIADCRPGC